MLLASNRAHAVGFMRCMVLVQCSRCWLDAAHGACAMLKLTSSMAMQFPVIIEEYHMLSDGEWKVAWPNQFISANDNVHPAHGPIVSDELVLIGDGL